MTPLVAWWLGREKETGWRNGKDCWFTTGTCCGYTRIR
jgi:hypothetical protein